MQVYEAEQWHTKHYRERAEQRGLSPEVESFLLRWGTEVQAGGARHLTLLRRDLPRALRDSENAERARDWILVGGEDGALITCYRRRNAWRFLQKKKVARRRRRGGGR